MSIEQRDQGKLLHKLDLALIQIHYIFTDKFSYLETSRNIMHWQTLMPS